MGKGLDNSGGPAQLFSSLVGYTAWAPHIMGSKILVEEGVQK